MRLSVNWQSFLKISVDMYIENKYGHSYKCKQNNMATDFFLAPTWCFFYCIGNRLRKIIFTILIFHFYSIIKAKATDYNKK